ncbi:Na+/H+ antiporter NhaC [Nitrosomonas ureae]|uniref:Na+:H+ antiporter, NhaC family n=1 Tax=Nitrosomonas ureae TaxID=44577 RepID=A0A1H9HEB0_9PROT|nr:Na+/H+ antiporter NhaC [Nitrosomonas ureae]PTQ79230.1 transporter (NhaC family) [Nitrosomonas ureae]PXX07984.1 transporter (NhaC family) [Nitrosomonas ureae]SEQ60675.1 Na+:H+ antiporter, NhaC family [Nitrosomonas ureae]
MTEQDVSIDELSIACRLPSFFHAVFCFSGVLLLISLGLFVWQASLHALIFLALIWVSIQTRGLGYSFVAIRRMMDAGITKALPAIYIFLLIGMVIASFMQSGTIASLLYYGLDWLNPSIFLVVGFVLCGLMSIATGTSWGTVGTVGIVLIGIGDAMSIPLPLVAGAIVSGATFGDKLSPISDTTNLAAMSAGTSLYRHIGSMLYTSMPTFIIVLIIFTIWGMQYDRNALPENYINEIRDALADAYQLDLWVTLLPLLLMLGLSIQRYAAEVSMSCSILLAMLIAVVYQGRDGVDVINALWINLPETTGIESIDTLLGRGGIYSMAWTLLLSILALALGGIMHHAGFLRVLLLQIISRIQRISTLIFTTIAAGFLGNIAMGEAYISIILNCQLFKGAYQEKELDPAILSRSVEEGSTLTTGLIPWTTAGTFYAATLGVPTLDYAGYALLNLLNPLVSIVMAILGIGLLQKMR